MQDYHLHTHHSADSNMSLLELCRLCVSNGVKDIAITDHTDFDPYDIGYQYLDYDNYCSEIEHFQKKFNNTLNIKKGIELGLQSYYGEEYNEFLAGKNFDFIIGSIHMINHKDIFSGEYFDGLTEDEAYDIYLKETLDAIIACRTFDVLGHLDLVYRYIPQSEHKKKPIEKYRHHFEKIFSFLINDNKGIEINTSGLRFEIRETNPGIELLQLYHDMGGQLITFGSDAHKPQYVNFSIKQTMEMAKSIGFKYYTVYSKRTPKFITLDV